jgi:hypothetical protein
MKTPTCADLDSLSRKVSSGAALTQSEIELVGFALKIASRILNVRWLATALWDARREAFGLGGKGPIEAQGTAVKESLMKEADVIREKSLEPDRDLIGRTTPTNVH